MSHTESLVADFVGSFASSELGIGDPITGRVLMSDRRLVLVGGDERVTIPLDGMFDVSMGQVPPELVDYFDDTVTIGYRRGSHRHVAVVEGPGESIERFTTVLFKVQLHDTPVSMTHPERVGGRVTNETTQEATLRIRPKAVEFVCAEDVVRIDLASVSRFERRGTGDSAELAVHHDRKGTALVTAVELSSDRKLNVLGRYLRREYEGLLAEVSELSLGDDELEALVTLYSVGESANLTGLLGDPSRATMVVNSLESKGLIVDTDRTTKLTTMGTVVVREQIEDVNV